MYDPVRFSMEILTSTGRGNSALSVFGEHCNLRSWKQRITFLGRKFGGAFFDRMLLIRANRNALLMGAHITRGTYIGCVADKDKLEVYTSY